TPSRLPPGRGEPPATADGLDRPLPDSPQRQGHAARGNARRAQRPRPSGEGALPGGFDRYTRRVALDVLRRLEDGRVALVERTARARTLRLDAAAVLDFHARGGAGDLPSVSGAWFRGNRLEPAGRRVAGRPLPQGQAGARGLACPQPDGVRRLRR